MRRGRRTVALWPCIYGARAIASPVAIGGVPLSAPVIARDNTTAAAIDLGINSGILVSSGALVTSALSALDLPDQAGAYAIDAAGGNGIIIFGRGGVAPDPFTLPGGRIRDGAGSRVLVTDGGIVYDSQGGPATAPEIEFLGPGSSVTVDSGGQILGGFAPAVRADAPGRPAQASCATFRQSCRWDLASGTRAPTNALIAFNDPRSKGPCWPS